MIEIEQYRTDLMEEVKVVATQGEFKHSAFVSLVTRKLVEAEELSDWTECYFRDKGSRRRDLWVDGFLLEDVDVDSSVTLLVADFRGGEAMESITGAQLSTVCDRALNFVEEAIAGRLQDLEQSKSYYDLADWLYRNASKIASLRIYVLTDALLNVRVKELPSKKLGKIRVEIQLWDVGRFFRADATGGREPIEIDLTEFVKGGIPVLRASQNDADYEAYLLAVPAVVLADLYDRYGSRLLEGNVRSFLAVRGGVNKGIRSTIIGEPHRFFAYNNGVAGTATDVSIVEKDGIGRLTRLRDFQIVNGGQTTASLFTARRKDNADLSRIFVQIKLSVVTPDQAGELIPLISRYANSQNKVSEADFFANHLFHRRMEDISRRIWAPAANGVAYQTKWFYERARGQYLNEQATLSAGKKKSFQLQHPKSQLITKTDLAKFHNSWERLPDVVSLGAQKNFVRFAEAIAPAWDADENFFNERWFRIAVGKAILFAVTEDIVSDQPWYQGGYRANIVTYTVALLSHLVHSEGRRTFDFEQLWRLQALPPALEPVLAALAKLVFDVVVNPPGENANVTEWCKKEDCWKGVRNCGARLDKEVVPFLLAREEEAEEKKGARKEQSMTTKLERLTYIVGKGVEYWARALEWNASHNILVEKERSIVSMLAKRRGFVPSDPQAVVVIEAEKRLYEDGFR
jgi:hypothetical protein